MTDSTAASSSPKKKVCLSWFDELVSWVRQSSEGFVAENTVEWDDASRTLRTIQQVAEGEILFRIPTIAAGATDADLAWHLATRPASIRPYLASLPAHLLLPRDHPDWDVLLNGSPVLGHVQQSRQQVREAFDALSSKETSATPVSWDSFRSSYNAVTSRAFDGPVMVPLLDLCDHVRGAGQQRRRNVAYIVGNDGMAVARAEMPLVAGTKLSITYGAQSNAQLYVNYGFCVEHNTEPDGSSNDVLEWADGILLRTGPRSYTYGPLVKALELAGSMNNPKETFGGQAAPEDDADSINDFLNDCEGEDKDEMDDYDGCYEELDEAPVEEQKIEAKEHEIRAIRLLHEQLVTRGAKYKTFDTCEQSHEPTSQFAKYAAILLRSEQRILQFYVTVLCKLAPLVLNSDDDLKLQRSSFVQMGQSEQSVVDQQTSDLCEAYMQIRHPAAASSGH